MYVIVQRNCFIPLRRVSCKGITGSPSELPLLIDGHIILIIKRLTSASVRPRFDLMHLRGLMRATLRHPGGRRATDLSLPLAGERAAGRLSGRRSLSPSYFQVEAAATEQKDRGEE